MKTITWRAALALCLWLSSASDSGAQTRPNVSTARIDRVEQWLKAVARHGPGLLDEASDAIDRWSNGEGRDFWVDASVLVKLIRSPRRFGTRFEIAGPRGRPVPVLYTTQQIRRLTVLACAAAGLALTDDACRESHAAESLDDALRMLNAAARDARRAGDPNLTLRRGALLHTDIAIGGPLASGPASGRASAGPQHFRLDTSDGQQVSTAETAIHWELARLLLDAVGPLSSTKPDPSRDEMVRRWYRATATWMQYRKDHQPDHLDRAQQLFPRDPDILFLNGCLHEIVAMPLVQSAVKSAVLPPGMSLDVESDQVELRRAESFFRRALDAKPDFAEARLRYGHVLARLGRHDDAARELRQALTGLDHPQLLYDGELFLGGEERLLGNVDAARAHLERASARFPTAQSPRIALSELARSRGDRAGALVAIRQLFHLAPDERDRIDPWWSYDTVQARDAEDLVRELWVPYGRRGVPQ